MKSQVTKISLVLTLLAVLPVARGLAADGSAETPFRYYSTVDGLTQSDVYDIEQDRAGYLWFTTARGLNRYDGTKFDHYTIADGLPSNGLTALHVAEDNTIRIGDVRGGVSVVRGSRIVQVIDPVSDYVTPITDIEVVAGRVLAIAEGVGVLEVVSTGKSAKLVLLGGEDTGAVNMAVFGRDVWIVGSTGLYKLKLDSGFSLQHLSETVNQVHAGEDGTIWVANKDHQLGVWANGRFEIRAALDTSSDLIGLTSDLDGVVWATSEHELFSFDSRKSWGAEGSGAVQNYEGVEQLTSLFVDRENTLWLSSDSRLMRYLGDRFEHFRLRTGSEPETIWSVSEDTAGRFWFGTQTKLLLRQLDESISIIGPEHGIPGGAVRDLAYDGASTMWVGIRGEGLFELDLDSLKGQLIPGTEKLEILDVAVTGAGRVWLSTLDSGLLRYSPASKVVDRFPSPKNTSVYSMDISSDGSVWYGADEVGLVHLSAGENGQFVQEIFDSGSGLGKTLFNQVRLSNDKDAWVATEEGGLYQFEAGSFTNYGAVTPLADQTVYLLEPLENGNLIVGGEQGLYQFVPETNQIDHYNQLLGFIGVETNVHATFMDSNNNLWIGTIDGAARMDVSKPMLQHLEPASQIISINTKLDELDIEDNAQIDPRQRGMHVEFAAVSLINPNGIEYSYRLLGLESEWGGATSNRSVSYSTISPGSYEFMVRARYPGGDWSRRFASRRFTITPFFWQQPWFYLPAILIILLLIRSAMVYRTRNIARLNETLRNEVSGRTKSIEQAKQRLEESNENLSREIAERQKSDKARAEVETRFRRAFENVPIGIGVLDTEARLVDANPALQQMFWPESDEPPKEDFSQIIEEPSRDEFDTLFEHLKSSEKDSFEEKFTCVASSGEVLQTVVSLSAVRDEQGDFLYAVLQVQDVTESLKMTGLLEYQASYDELTRLLNRRSFETELARAWDLGQSGQSLSFLMIMDLDQFKVVNDTSGHAAGDQLLKRVSEILVDIVRGNDSVCRLGGDEFGIILWKCPPDVARRIAESIRASIENFQFQWDSENYRIGISIGGLAIDPNVGDIGELQQLADAACYAAKEAGRNRVHMVTGGEDSARLHRGQVRWVQRLREAMDNKRFAIYGQAIRPLAENVDEPERFEVLLRLRDRATRKLIPPGAFLPAAERYGMSVELDQWVVKSLLDTLFIHQSFHTEYRKYWINLSGTSIGDTRFAKFLVDAVEKSPLPRGTINFEITETAVIRNVVEAGKLMAELREMGCQFALDDFGRGLSSFGYLKELPIDYLKIDGMFVRDIVTDKTNRIFVKSIIDIAHTLNIKTIAEYIENDEMLDVVRNLGADYAQGFVIAEPFALAPNFPNFVESEHMIVDIQQAG